MSIIDKIYEEESVLNDNIFHIVRDKHPICHNHLMAMSKKRVSGSAKLEMEYHNQLFKKILHFYEGDFYFFERGNASFCTSLHEESCSHIHFIPSLYFDPSLVSLLIEETDKIGIAFEKIQNIESEYFYFGCSTNSFFYQLKEKPKKQFFREFFTSNLVNHYLQK